MHAWALRCSLFLIVPVTVFAAACDGSPSAPPLSTDEPTLTYIGADSTIWLVSPTGGDPRRFADARACGRSPQLSWSPDGQRLACRGAGPEGDPGPFALYDAEGRIIAERIEPLHGLHWSLDGTYLLGLNVDGFIVMGRGGTAVAEVGPVEWGPAYVAVAQPHALWSSDGDELAYWHAEAQELRIYTIASQSERAVPGDFRPLAWVLGGSALLVASGYVELPPEAMVAPTYDVSLLDLASGEARRVPQLDSGRHIWANFRQFWVSPDGRRVAVLVPGTTAPAAMAVLDLKTGAFDEIEGSTISYPGDSIPHRAVRFSPDSAYVYWLTLEAGTRIFRATVEGTSHQRLSAWPESSTALSPDFAWFAFSDGELPDMTINVARIDGATSRVVATQNFGTAGTYEIAWRPVR